jgi:hypothetical protein
MPEDTTMQLISMLRSLMNDFNSHAVAVDEIRTQLHDIAVNVSSLLAAFPEGGLMGHRLFHEKMKQSCDDNHRLKESVKDRLIVSLATVALTFIAIATWEFIKIHVRT